MEVELPNSQGKVSRPRSPILIGDPSMIAAEHNSLSIMVDAFSNYFWLVITYLSNLGSLAMDLRNEELIKRDNTCSMNFFCSGSKLCFRDQYGNGKGG